MRLILVLFMLCILSCGDSGKTDNIKFYNFNRLELSQDYSLKNSQYFEWNDKWYIAATDMERGGTIILENTEYGWREYMLMFPGYYMMWAPNIINIDGKLYVFVCDHNTGIDDNDFTDNMRIYTHQIYMNEKDYGPLERVYIEGDEVGVIDPFVVRIDEWYYMFHVKINGETHFWDIFYSISDNITGPYTNSIRLNIDDRGIDEAFKMNYHGSFPVLCTWSSGDSGIDGIAFLGYMYVINTDLNGVKVFHVDEKEMYIANNSYLCTALDITRWPEVIATLRSNGYVDMRDNFYLGKKE